MSGSLHPMDCSLPGSSVHGILQARYWTRLPFPSPGDGSNPRTELVSLTSPALAGKFFTTVSPGKSPSQGWDKLMYWKDTWRSLSVIPALVSLPRSSFFFLFFFFNLKAPMFPCGLCHSWGRKSPSVILSPGYAKHIWAASMLMTIMNVSNFAENLVKKYISFLLRSIPLTTKLWFKIHNLLKSRTPLNKTVQSSDVQTFSYPRDTLFSFTAICQYVLFFFFQINSPWRTLGSFFHRE